MEQLRTDHPTRVHIPAYRVVRFTGEKNFRIDVQLSYNGDNDGFWNDRNNLGPNPLRILLHILINTKWIAN